MTKLQSKQSKEDRLKLARPQNIDALSPTTASTSRASLFLVLLPENYTGAASTATTTVKAAVALAGARSVVIFAVTGKLHGSCVNCHYNSEGARSVVMSAFLLLSPPIAAVFTHRCCRVVRTRIPYFTGCCCAALPWWHSRTAKFHFSDPGRVKKVSEVSRKCSAGGLSVSIRICCSYSNRSCRIYRACRSEVVLTNPSSVSSL